MRTERDVVLLEHAGGLRRRVRRDDGRVALSGEREGRVVDARQLDADGCKQKHRLEDQKNTCGMRVTPVKSLRGG